MLDVGVKENVIVKTKCDKGEKHALLLKQKFYERLKNFRGTRSSVEMLKGYMVREMLGTHDLSLGQISRS